MSQYMKPFIALMLILGFLTCATFGETEKPSSEELYQLGKQLFDQYAPPEIKEQYEFPSLEEAHKTLAKIEVALEKGSFGDIAQYKPQVLLLLSFLKSIPDQDDTLKWLESRIDEFEEVKAITQLCKNSNQNTLHEALNIPYKNKHLSPISKQIPYYDTWLKRAMKKGETSADPNLVRTLQNAFKVEGVPPQLIWIAEAESSMNTNARSPSGARGLFQLTSDTAKGLGLSTFLPDDRADPNKAASAAARYLKKLVKDLGSWPLAVAGYNAGEGRIKKLLLSRHATTYAQIADGLSAGTQMYVPKVLSLIEVRTGTSVENIANPN